MKRTDKRTTVSLAEVVWQMAEANMQAKGFNDNFSSYVADLIRRDKEHQEKKNLPDQHCAPMVSNEICKPSAKPLSSTVARRKSIAGDVMDIVKTGVSRRSSPPSK
jgi:non-homologous end joining protein Ku